MQTVYRGPVHVHYSQLYVESRVDDYFEGLNDARGGQHNGLCGAAVPGLLNLTTGLHTGNVEFTVEVHEDAPPLTDGWEDVVEVSFRPATDQVALVQWAGEKSWPLPLVERDYRVRYSGNRLDEGRRRDTRLDGEPLLDHYLLQFWPAPPAPDQVIRQTSEIAAYWHAHARTQPPPPPPPTPEEREAAARAAAEERRRERELARRRFEDQRWGDRPPSERLRGVPYAWSASRFDRDLVDAVAEADPHTQRAIACWAARQAMTEARLADLPTVAPALAALDRGEELPPPFDGVSAVWDILTDESVPQTTTMSWDRRHARISQQHAALPAVQAAAEADPLNAALGAIWHAGVTHGIGHPRLITALRAAFPQLSGPR